MRYFDLHVHTVFSDGKNTPEEMVNAAIDRGMDAIGFSDHSYTSFDGTYCIKKEAIPAYIAEIGRLREKYADRIRVLCGIEQDYYSDYPPDEFDYRIGSLHYVKAGDAMLSVDHSEEGMIDHVSRYFGGSYIDFAVSYFGTVAGVAEVTGADIIGHFDLVSKFNEGGRLFDEGDPRYREAWKAAVDRIMRTCRVFEINTGAMKRCGRSTPYPSPEIREYIREKGGRFILSSDAHSTDSLGFAFERVRDRTVARRFEFRR
jgi:histidinol-phosphatase (PHP family)